MIPFSILDLSPIVDGASAADALRNSGELAVHAERFGFRRYWLAEHHNMSGVASAATSVVIGYIAGLTRTIRVGSGGVMLPNHSPLVIAEQFGTLASLYPGRIDLGLGRAPGADGLTARALRRDPASAAERFPLDVDELLGLIADRDPAAPIRAVPGAGLDIPVWILGSSLFGAHLAAHLGLPFAFASHFAPEQMENALRVYRSNFQPSAQSEKPHAMLTVNIVAADTDAQASRLFTSQQQAFINLRRGQPGKLPAPVDNIDDYGTSIERWGAQSALARSFVGSVCTIEQRLGEFLAEYRPDELMVVAHIFDHDARKRSLELTAQIRDRLTGYREEVTEQPASRLTTNAYS